MGKNIIARIRFKGMIIEFYSYKSLRKFTQEFIINSSNIFKPKIPIPNFPTPEKTNNKLNEAEDKTKKELAKFLFEELSKKPVIEREDTYNYSPFLKDNPWLKVLAQRK